MAPKNSSRVPQQDANTLTLLASGEVAQAKRPKVENQPKPNQVIPAQQEQPPAWASSLMASIENLNQRIGLIESGAQRQAFNKAATFKKEGGVPLPPPAADPSAVQPVVPVVVPMAAPANTQTQAKPKAPMGESGSGYTRLPNGKLVRNKRPQPKPLQVRQAKNWRSAATTNLVNWLKTNGVGPEDPKPVENSQYQNAVINLAMAKDYMSYVKSNEAPLPVHEWRNAYQGIYTFESVTSEGNWADEVEASEAGETASQSNSGIVVSTDTNQQSEHNNVSDAHVANNGNRPVYQAILDQVGNTNPQT